MYRRLFAGALAAACALAIAACGVQFDGAPTGAQRDVIGDVVITTKLCSTGGEGDSCGPVGSSGPVQSILAYRVPAGAKAPALEAVSGVAFHQDTDLASFYQQQDPADGMRWFAFVSDVIQADGEQELSDSIDADFALPAGSPYHGPFAYRVTTGFRQLDDASQAGDPVSCLSEQAATRVAVEGDGPPSETPGAECDFASADGSIDTRDLALSGTTASRAHLRAATVVAGSGADVPFTATFAGSSTPDADFTLSASAPGLGAATVSPQHLVPAGDSATPLTVHVDVPAGTARGTYPITLTARLANGQARTATGSVTVTAPADPGAAPAAPATTTTTSPQGVTFTAPSTQTCVSRRVFTIMLLRHGRDIVGGTVTLNGKKVAVTRGDKHLVARIDLRGLPHGLATVRIRGRLAGGKSVSFTRRYRTCTTTPGSNELTRKQAI